MNEKIYKTMTGAGALNLAAGIITIAVGVAVGILLIVSGARLLRRKTDILF